jgi:large subunit ribosomal protein L31
MKQGIHPTYYPDAQVICACGNTWTTGSTRKMIRTDVCSACHPFFTGEQRIVDTAGQVDRFMRRLQQAEERAAQVQVQQKAEEAARKAAVQARARGESPKKAKQIAERAAEDVIASLSQGKQAEAPVVEPASPLGEEITETIAE